MKATKIIMILLTFFVIIYFLIGYLSSYIGWYGYKKWEKRKHSTSIEESIARKVFVKKLNYQIDSFYGTPFRFEIFIEKGFKWGYHSSKQTEVLNSSKYPFQLNYNYRPNQFVTVSIRKDQIKKFDSAGGVLAKPFLSDTVVLEIGGEGIKSGTIKIWN